MTSLILPDCLNDVYAFEKVIELEQKILATASPALDMSRVSFINPYSAVALLLIGKNYTRKTGGKIRLTGFSQAVLQYLERMDFLKKKIFDIDQDLADNMKLKRSASSRSVIEITDIPNKESESVRVISSVVTLFRKRAEHIFRSAMSDINVDSFVTVISEICQNIFEHSLDSGYVAIQTYKTGKGPVVHLVVADSGIGIEGSFARMNRDYGNGSDLLLKALTSPISSKREFGYGLCRVNDIVEQMNGNLYLRSNAASVAVINNPKTGRFSFTKSDIPFFQGTQISFFVSGGR